MKVLARSGPDSWKRSPIVHIPTVDYGAYKARALCSRRGPCEGDRLKDGAVWVVRDRDPRHDIMCAHCQAAIDKLNAPPKPEKSAWDKLSDRKRADFEAWERLTGVRHKDDPRGESDEEF